VPFFGLIVIRIVGSVPAHQPFWVSGLTTLPSRNIRQVGD
tara:strand:+ start:34 stop:153 length:120 start_codon:yes stop_codon:yes gene_type:complete